MPVRDESGAIMQRVIIIHDMTEQRLAEQELSDLKAMTRKAGHDLNNMITGLIVNLSLLNGAGFTDQQRESCLTDALDAARDGARTTRQLLDAINGRAPMDLEAIEEYHEAIAAREEGKPRVYRDPNPARSTKERFTSEDGDRGALLILDDDEKLLRMMSSFLEHAGYTVSATVDPKEAISLYREMMADGRCFDLVDPRPVDRRTPRRPGDARSHAGDRSRRSRHRAQRARVRRRDDEPARARLPRGGAEADAALRAGGPD